MENWRELCSVIHKGSPSFAVMREDGEVIEADSFDELIEAVKNDARVKPRSKGNVIWITRNGKKVPIRGGKMPNGRSYSPQVGSEIVVQGELGTIRYRVTSAEEFRRGIFNAKKTVDPKAAWRVDDTHKTSDFRKGVSTFTTKHGSTVAVKPDGDIISVCKKVGDVAKGSDLIRFAVANGGKKLDSFDGNYKFYTKNGFEPVSRTPFVEEYAPHDWVKTRDLPEEIIFFKYTGKQTKMTIEKFRETVPLTSDYQEAGKIRDRSM